MKTPSRRTLLKWLGILTPAFGVGAGSIAAPDLLKTPVADQHEAILGLGHWLSRQGITHASLDRIEGGGESTGDIRNSFERDALITVDGFLLPTGFCRYCLDEHLGRIENNQNRVDQDRDDD